MFYGLNKFIKKFLPKRLFYRSLIIVAAPIILLQLTITIVFFDSLWIKANKGMTRSLVSEIVTIIDVYNNKNAGSVIHKAKILAEDGAILSLGKNICKTPLLNFILKSIISL